MNKKQLIEALEAYPDHAEILVAVGSAVARMDQQLDRPSLVYYNHFSAKVFGVAYDPVNVVLEL